ncbi:MAG: bifunctional diaminohydroxyphosphoribosylaminopyrimidine deaminase/5-amino-6-(5-phosphoribosylamino)uracil reductase RibD [Chthoniobacterales bacterium]
MAPQDDDERWMRVAVEEARRGLGSTSPNPAVGAVLAVRGKIVATGFHRRAGAPHAEIECLRNFAAPIPSDATLYVTLEPCSTRGRTGPCTTALISAGVRHVVIGAVDPNPIHRGRGVQLLREAGLNVRVGLLADECNALNEAYNKWIETGLPFVIAKCGMSLDGRLTAPPNASRWITSAAARRHAQQLRARVDAILVGAETIRADDPRLTVRGIAGAKQPWRVILSRSGRLRRNATVFTDRFADKTVVFRNKSLVAVLRELGRREITSVLIEGGGEVLGAALDAQLIDRVQMYLGPVLTGGPVIAFSGRGFASSQVAARLEDVRYEKIQQDLCIRGRPVYRAPAKNPSNSRAGNLLNHQKLNQGSRK